jgi:hypothetical protein
MESGHRILFCDYDGDFEVADRLSLSGYVVDQIRPSGLRAVTVGDHAVYLFSFQSASHLESVLKICHKLKSAELQTPIVLMNLGEILKSFDDHAQTPHSANFYVQGENPEEQIIEILANGLQLSPAQLFSASSEGFALGSLKDDEITLRMRSLETELETLRAELEQSKKEIARKGDDLRPKLKAMLEGEKKKAQTETERLKVRLSEVEAKLLDREARLVESQRQIDALRVKMIQVKDSAQKSQAQVRDFYVKKIRELEVKLGLGEVFSGASPDAEEKISSLADSDGLSADPDKTEILPIEKAEKS